ncbi:unnamed protein product [Arctogadus glacialis]
MSCRGRAFDLIDISEQPIGTLQARTASIKLILWQRPARALCDSQLYQRAAFSGTLFRRWNACMDWLLSKKAVTSGCQGADSQAVSVCVCEGVEEEEELRKDLYQRVGIESSSDRSD